MTVNRKSDGKFARGGAGYWLGKKLSNETKTKLSKSHTGVNTNESHPTWKGDKASYATKHQWVARKLGKPRLCSHCGTLDAKRYEWANISKEYKRNLDDYIRLCKSCHMKYDNVASRAWETKRLAI